MNHSCHRALGLAIAVTLVTAGVASADPTITGTFYTHTQTTPNQLFSIRGVAVGQGATAGDVYYSHIQPAADGVLTTGLTQIVHLSSTGTLLGSADLAANAQAKAIATDSLGRVYSSINQPGFTGVYLYNSSLSGSPEVFAVPGATEINGVDVRDAGGGQFHLYVSNRAYSVSDTSFVASYNMVNIADPSTWTLDWQKTIPGQHSLRDVALDGAGNVWVADHDNNVVFEVSANGSTVTSTNPAVVPMTGPVGMVVAAPDGVNPFVFAVGENDTQSAIYEIDPADLTLKASYSLSQLPSTIPGGASNYGLGGIAFAGADHFFLSNEDGGVDGTGHSMDFIYTATAPEPAGLLLLGAGVVVAMARRRGVRGA